MSRATSLYLALAGAAILSGAGASIAIEPRSAGEPRPPPRDPDPVQPAKYGRTPKTRNMSNPWKERDTYKRHRRV
jgi:hypothetical protein